jgi:hypothetical protein
LLSIKASSASESAERCGCTGFGLAAGERLGASGTGARSSASSASMSEDLLAGLLDATGLAITPGLAATGLTA